MEFLGRFSRNRGALAGAVVILLVALAAILAPVFFPTDPLRIVGPPLSQSVLAAMVLSMLSAPFLIQFSEPLVKKLTCGSGS